MRVALAAALATLTAGCGALFNNAPTLHALERAPQPQLERVDALPSELPARTSAALDPQTLVARAHHRATLVVGEAQVSESYDDSYIGENLDTDAWTEGWLRVDEAIVFAELATAQRPEPQPVTVERQRAAMDQREVLPGEIKLHVPGSGERYRVRLYDNAGRMRPEAVRELSWALRDRRANRARTIRPRVLAMLYMIGQHYDAELEIISGYRIRGVNASRGSRHGSGEACDLRVPGVGIRTTLRYVESTFANIGVGYYPTSGFIHIDDRDVTYYWIDSSGPGERSRTRTRNILRRAAASDDVTLRSVHITEQELYQWPPELRDRGYEGSGR